MKVSKDGFLSHRTSHSPAASWVIGADREGVKEITGNEGDLKKILITPVYFAYYFSHKIDFNNLIFSK